MPEVRESQNTESARHYRARLQAPRPAVPAPGLLTTRVYKGRAAGRARTRGEERDVRADGGPTIVKDRREMETRVRVDC